MSAKILRFPDGQPEPERPRRLCVSLADYVRDGLSVEPGPRPQLVRDMPVRRIIAVGLLSYALWRFIAAFLDSEHEGSTLQALSTRAGYLGRGLIYGGVAAYAIRGVFGPEHVRQGDTLPKWSARLMSMPAGRWLVAAAALTLVWIGILEIRRGIRREFKRYLRLEEMTSLAIQWTTATGTGGHIARGILFGLMGLSGLF
jgi:hypothetical protein